MPATKHTGALAPQWVTPRITQLPVITLGDDWRAYATSLPPGWQCWGSVTLPDGQRGALISHVMTDTFAMLAYGDELRQLDQREVRAALSVAVSKDRP